MEKQAFLQMEALAQSYMEAGGVHDAGHQRRVLYNALRIAKTEPKADETVVVLAALLHDIARGCEGAGGHAEKGAAMAYEILLREGYAEKTAAHVRDCIYTHSYKAGRAPKTLEAKILFDADKLDLAGAMGTARALLFGAEIDEPLYRLDEKGLPLPGKKEEGPSLLREYNRKLKGLAGKFYTEKGRKMAEKRQKAMDAWFRELKKEIYNGYIKGNKILKKMLED